MMFPVPSHLPYLCKLIHRSLGLPVFYMEQDDTTVYEFAPGFALNPMYKSRNELLHELFLLGREQPAPIMHKTRYEEVFAMVPVRMENGAQGVMIAGPCLDSEPSEFILKSIMNDTGLPAAVQEPFVRYFESLPCIPLIDLVFTCTQLHYMLYREPIDPTDIYRLSQSLHSQPARIEHPELLVARSRQSSSLHHDAEFEARLLQAIKEGNKEKVNQCWQEFPRHGQPGILSRTSLLRSKKNMAIAVITLATRAAAQGGLDYETALTLSDLYIQAVENIRSSSAADRFMLDVLTDFAERVYQKKRQRYSRGINACLDYIFKHLYEEITLADLAEQAALHPNYLSALFRREVGRTLQDYIRDAKIEEAANLLRLTDRPISEVSTLLGFHDQSYFTKTFKKVMGVTPKRFKRGQSSSADRI
ncbi:helix-turn-helix transcriptional regulator [Paenibacillus sp. P26]|nr:helix-turn-helix transcriptional regulator [Paenibacillus sp. P26]